MIVEKFEGKIGFTSQEGKGSSFTFSFKLSPLEDNQIDGLLPAVIFGHYGQTVMLGEVEVDSTINSESIERWKLIQNLGISLIIFVPKVKLKVVRDMCWENKLIEKVKVSFFSVEIPLK